MGTARTTIRPLFAVVLCLVAGTSWAGAPAAAPACANCHGDTGVSADKDTPTIAGISAFALEDQLGRYKAGERPCVKSKGKDGKSDDMCEVAKKLPDADVTALAAYFAALPFVPTKNTVDPGKVAAGKALHEAQCEKCHTQGGSVAEDDASLLAGQPRGYLVLALRQLRAGERVMDKKMAPKIKALKDADAEALIEFYASGGK